MNIHHNGDLKLYEYYQSGFNFIRYGEPFKSKVNFFAYLSHDDDLMEDDTKVSAANMLLYRSYSQSWERGEKYADQGRVKLIEYDDRGAKGETYGTKKYDIKLVFRSGGISRSCYSLG